MGIEQNKHGAYLPDKNTKWPEMKDPERSKVYESHKEKYAGTMAKYTNEREKAKDKYWEAISNDFDYTDEYAATDPKLKGMPVSMALLLAFQREFKLESNNRRLEYLGKEITDLMGKERNLMLYSLNYLQNAAENKALRKAEYPRGNIDLIPRDGLVKIVKVKVPAPDWGRWQLQILDKNKKVLFAGFMFPGWTGPVRGG